jgi:hypothetical protein
MFEDEDESIVLGEPETDFRSTVGIEAVELIADEADIDHRSRPQRRAVTILDENCRLFDRDRSGFRVADGYFQPNLSKLAKPGEHPLPRPSVNMNRHFVSLRGEINDVEVRFPVISAEPVDVARQSHQLASEGHRIVPYQ